VVAAFSLGTTTVDPNVKDGVVVAAAGLFSKTFDPPNVNPPVVVVGVEEEPNENPPVVEVVEVDDDPN
jgi:hypothetical protein